MATVACMFKKGRPQKLDCRPILLLTALYKAYAVVQSAGSWRWTRAYRTRSMASAQRVARCMRVSAFSVGAAWGGSGRAWQSLRAGRGWSDRRAVFGPLRRLPPRGDTTPAHARREASAPRRKTAPPLDPRDVRPSDANQRTDSRGAQAGGTLAPMLACRARSLRNRAAHALRYRDRVVIMCLGGRR